VIRHVRTIEGVRRCVKPTTPACGERMEGGRCDGLSRTFKTRGKCNSICALKLRGLLKSRRFTPIHAIELAKAGAVSQSRIAKRSRATQRSLYLLINRCWLSELRLASWPGLLLVRRRRLLIDKPPAWVSRSPLWTQASLPNVYGAISGTVSRVESGEIYRTRWMREWARACGVTGWDFGGGWRRD